MDYLGPLPTTPNRIAKYSELGAGGGSGDVAGPASSTDNAIARFDLATGKLLQDSAVTVSDVGVVNLPALTSPTAVAGSVYYDSTNKALAVKNDESAITLQVGQENWVRVFNNTGSTISDAQAVYITGSDAGTGLPTIALARSDVFATTVCVGLATHSIEAGTIGYITAFGSVRDLNTSGFTAGPIFLSSTTAGALTQTIPNYPAYAFRVGNVSKVDATTGIIHVQLGVGTQNNIFNYGKAYAFNRGFACQ